MSGNIFGSIFQVMTFGESHGVAVGAVVDGCPSNVSISIEDFQQDLNKRRAKIRENNLGIDDFFSLTTERKEKDECKILSGIVDDKTLGTPIAVVVENHDINPTSYESLHDVYRPSHADYTYEKKFNSSLFQGGGRASGRETIGRVLAGTIARKLIEKMSEEKGLPKIIIETRLNEIAGIKLAQSIKMEEELPVDVVTKIKKIREEGDSIGAILECDIFNVQEGLGEPVFSKLDAELSKAIISIGGVKGVEFGSGFECARLKGSENNDIYKNHNGGIFGGISDGSKINLSIALKPIPSIKKKQRAYSKDGRIKEISIEGRHDICLFPRIVPVIEAMCFITLADAWLLQNRNRFF
ncbi:MAG: chorismate synthase [Treponema sp.]